MNLLHLALLALLLPLASFGLLAVFWPLRHKGRLAGAMSSLFALASLGAAIAALLRYEHPLQSTVPWLVHRGQVIAELGVRVDGISLSMLAVVAIVATGVQIYSLGYLDGEPEHHQGRYFAWQSLFLFSMQSLVLAPNLLQAFAGWELVGLCSYLLIGYYWRKPSAAKAAVKAFWVTKFADMGLMVGVIALFATSGSFDWNAALTPHMAAFVAAMVLMGVIGKSAQFPLHVWLPDAMEGPTPVSALLHAATMVAAGVFLIARTWPIFAAAPDVLLFMAWLGSISAFIAGVTAIVQSDIKKILAYSTASQLGYMVAAMGSGSLMGGYFHLTTHAFFKGLLFLGAGAAIHAVHSNDIFDMGGLLKKLPVSSTMFIIGAISLVALPPFAGFYSKDLILEELLEAGLWVPLGLLVITAGLTAFYMTRLVAIAYFGKPREGHLHESPLTMLVPMGVLAALALGGGFMGGRLGELWGAEFTFHALHFTPVGLTALAFSLAGLGLGWVQYGMGREILPDLAPVRRFILSGPVDRFWEYGAWRGALLPLARGIGWFDRYIIDGLINLIGWAFIRLSDRLRRLQTGRVHDYVYAVVVGIILFAAYGTIAE